MVDESGDTPGMDRGSVAKNAGITQMGELKPFVRWTNAVQRTRVMEDELGDPPWMDRS